MYKWIGVVGVIVLLVIVTAFVLTQGGEISPDTNTRVEAPVTTPETGENEDVVSPTLTEARSENIVVTSPKRGETVGNPFTVSGEARTFEQVVNYRLSDSEGKVLAEGTTMASADELGEFGPFEINVEYPAPTADTGVLEVFQASARDGSEIDKVRVEVDF